MSANCRSYLLHEIKGLTTQDAMLSRSLSESDVSELCGGGSVKGPSPTDDRDLVIGGHRMVAPSVGVGGNDDDGAGAYLGYVSADDRAASLLPQPPRPVLPPKQRRGGGGGFGNDPASQPNGGAQQRGGGGGSAAAAVAPGNVAIGARL